MVKVYVVAKRLPDCAMVNDCLTIYEGDMCEILGVFQKESDARVWQEKMVNTDIVDPWDKYDFGEADITVEEWEVQ